MHDFQMMKNSLLSSALPKLIPTRTWSGTFSLSLFFFCGSGGGGISGDDHVISDNGSHDDNHDVDGSINDDNIHVDNND